MSKYVTDGSEATITGTIVSYTGGQILFSPVDYMVGQTAPVRNAGNFTTGVGFQVTGTVVITGVRFHWIRLATDRTIKCSIFNGAGTNIATVNKAVTASGTYVATFGSPLTVTQADALTTTYFKAAVWDNSSTEYTRYATNPGIIGSFPFIGGTKVLWKNWNAFAAGDANPTGSGAEFFPVEPLFA